MIDFFTMELCLEPYSTTFSDEKLRQRVTVRNMSTIYHTFKT